MLGSATLATRVAGIHALRRLAREFPDEYHGHVGALLCAFVRFPTDAASSGSTGPGGTVPMKRVDVAEAVSAVIRDRRKRFEVLHECCTSAARTFPAQTSRKDP